jgi:ABC-type sugar transport system ATPase subunit
MSAARPVAEVRALVKRFPGVLAVDGVSIAFAPGEIVGLVGKNGAGKSTVIKALAGVVAPDAGSLVVDGRPVVLRDAHHATELGLAFVHQELPNVNELSVAENVLMGLGYPRRMGLLLDRDALRRRAAAVLVRLEADVDPDALVGSLSIAEQRLVSIARALAFDARLLVLDEPTASLTHAEIGHLHQVLRTLREQGVAIVYVSHRLDEILTLTDRVVVMRDGRVVGQSATAALGHGQLVAAITGRATRTQSAPAQGAAVGRERLRVEGLTREGVVEDVSFSVRAGELVGLAGLAGAGRTELARLIFGADPATRGRVLVDGAPVDVGSPRDAIDAGIAMVPEDRRGQGAVMDFSIRENVTLASLPLDRAVRGIPIPSRRRERAATRRLMERLAVRAPHEETRTALLSGGNQQKVVLAKLLRRDADVLIFDEPTHGVDVEAKQELYALMAELAAAGKAVLFISSEFAELVAVCPRVLVLREGRLVSELAGDAVTEAAIVDRCYAAA